MISINLNCRLALYAYITYIGKQSCHSRCCKFIIQSTNCTCSGWEGRNADIFRYGNSRGLHILLKEVVCMMNICHVEMNHDKINSRGESKDFAKDFHCPPQSPQQNQRSEVTAGLHWIKRKIHPDTCYRCILHFSPQIHLHLRQGDGGEI